MAKQIEDLEKKAAQSTTAVNGMVGMRRGELLKSLGVLVAHAARQPRPLAKNVASYGKELSKIVKGTSELAPERRDRRFMDPTWQYNPIYKRGLQSWLAMRQGLEGWIDDSGISGADKARSRFVLDILIDSFAPTNTLLGNPAAMKRFYETGGMSVVKGLKNVYKDITTNGGMPSTVDKSKFEVGKNVAASKGSVVFKNEMLEIIQYSPTTDKVYKTPLVIVPPQINKFYANDLSAHNSVIKYFAAQGYQMFAVSWRNPQRQHSHWGLENYVQSLIEGTDAVMKITKSKTFNVSGACSGGATLSLFLSELAARGDKRVNAYTLMVCVLDPKKSD
ncbi:MAG: class II poly(R)-hydroxyalkanoic acid synthase, partial [Robiginitomaculum sp.]|nr:class II poly(R)-hydroxyalkanoic acid synthase [Robiginitomaculum sp.]